MFGELALLQSGKRVADATAVGFARAMDIDKPRFRYLMAQQPAFALAMMRSLALHMGVQREDQAQEAA